MTRINTNLTSLQAQNNLYNNEGSLQTSLQRLSTGLRINSGKDDPSGLIAASVLGSEVVGIGQAITNSQRANNIVATADAALSQVSTLLNNIAGLVEASANKGAISASEIAANQVQVDSAIDSIDRIGQTTVFGGDQLLNGTKAFNVTGSLGSVFQSTSNIQVNSANPNSNVALQVSHTATKATTNIVGDSQGTAGAGLANLSLDSGTTRATATLVTNSFDVGSTNTSLNDLSTASTRATQTITGAKIAALGGGANNTLNLTVTGNLGSANITVNVGDATTGIKSDDNNLITAINAVSSQTGVVATGSGGNGDVTLKSSFVGSTATVGITATTDANGYAGTDSSLTLTDTGGWAGIHNGNGVTLVLSGVDKTTGAAINNVNVAVDTTNVTNAASFATAINTAITTANPNLAIHATGSGNDLVLTSTYGSATPILSSTATGNAANASVVNGATQASTNGTATDQDALNAAVGTMYQGLNGSNSQRKITEATLQGLAADSSSTVDIVINGDTGSQTLTGLNLKGTSGIDTSSYLAQQINTVTASTGVRATVLDTGDVVLSSTTAGAAGTANVSFKSYSGVQSTLSFSAASFSGLQAGTVNFSITGLYTGGSLNASPVTGSVAITAGMTAANFATALQSALGTTDATVTTSGGQVVISSGGGGTTAVAATFTDPSGDAAAFQTAVGSGTPTNGAGTAHSTFAFTSPGALTPGTVNFSIGGLYTGGVLNASPVTGSVAITAGMTASQFATALQTALGTTNATVTAAGSTVTIDSGANSSTAVTVSFSSDADVVQTAAGAGTSTTGVAAIAGDFTAANAAVGSLTPGSIGGTTFTITGNKGSAQINTATIGGNDAIINAKNAIVGDNTTNSGANALAGLINNYTGSTGITASINSSGNVVLTSDGTGSASVAKVTATGSGNDATIVTTGHALTNTAGADGTSNQTTLQLIGDKGRAVVTINNNDVINDSSTLVSAINAVTSQTGITASGSGAGGNVTLTSASYGSAAQVSISAIAATNSADISLFNAGGTQQTTAGKDVSGTITTSSGSSQFTGQGAVINYSDSSINFAATTTPTLAAPTAATTTILGTGGAGAGLNNLTPGGNNSNTISFTVQGATGNATISGINVAQLQGDSRVLVNAINKVSAQTGVVASTQAVGGSYALSNIVLTSTIAGSDGSVSITASGSNATTFNNAGTFTATAAGTAAPVTAAAQFNVSGGALFQIGPQVNLTNQVNVNITDLDTHLLGQNVGTTGSLSLHDLRTGGSQVLSGSDLTNAATIVQQAISQIATLRGQLGALQANVLESNISSQQTALEQVTSAQSSIQDADFATETANLTRAQVLVQAGTSVLAIANQQPQSVLALLPRG